MIIEAHLREFLHQQGVLEEFIANAKAQNPKAEKTVFSTIIGAFNWGKTPEGNMYWLRLHRLYVAKRTKYHGILK